MKGQNRRVVSRAKLGRYEIRGTSDSVIKFKTPLWRYMTFEKFCWLIETSKLYHTRLDQFEDPFEGAVTDAYAKARNDGTLQPHFSEKEMEPLIFKSLRLRSYATCWHSSEHESDAQWKLYASGDAGIAVVSTMERLQKSVTFLPHRHGILRPVDYVDFTSHDMLGPFGEPMRPGHFKRKSFEHEKEVRGIIIGNLSHGTAFNETDLKELGEKLPKGFEAKVNLRSLIQAIVIGPLAKPYIEKLVRIVTNRKRLEHLVDNSQLGGKPVF